MAKKQPSIKAIIKRYLKALEEDNIHVNQAILFGSRARKEGDQWSDIDIAIVSETFEGDRFNDRARIRKTTLSVSSDLSPIPFRPEDFTPNDPFVREILSTGRRVI